MSELTRLEEQILLSVWRLGENAYGLTIYEHIKKVAEKKIAIGGIYFPLERLVKKRYLDAFQGDPTPVRGGQSKRYYRLTDHGLKALERAKEVYEAFWEGLSRIRIAG